MPTVHATNVNKIAATVFVASLMPDAESDLTIFVKRKRAMKRSALIQAVSKTRVIWLMM